MGSRWGTFFFPISLPSSVATPFDVLGIDPDANRAAVERAYRRRVKETHPDLGGSASEFLRVREAYEDITNGTLEGDEDGTEGMADVTDEEAPAEQDQAVRTVEYLNYDRLVDHGWNIDDPDLFRKAAAADLDLIDHGEFEVYQDESLLEAAEKCGFAWPYACRGGACANCAVGLVAGELAQPVDHILPPDLVERGFRLSCLGEPVTDELQVVFNVKHLPELDDLRLPPGPFRGT